MASKTIYYSTICQVQSAAEKFYRLNNARTTFVDTLLHLVKAGQLPTARPDFPAFFDYLPDQEFMDAVNGLPINVSQIISKSNQPRIVESTVIPPEKDVFTFKHLPFVDDSLHSHDCFEINYVYSGSSILFTSDQKKELKKGEFIIVAPAVPHNVLVGETDLVMSIMVRKSAFDMIFWNLLAQNELLSNYFQDALYQNGQSRTLFFEADNCLETRRLIQNITAESNKGDHYGNVSSNSLLNLIFVRILRQNIDSIQLYPVDSRSDRDFDFTVFLQYIQQNYQTVTLGSLSKMFHYSEAYLSKMIKKNLTQNFTETIRNLKMQHAANYLDKSKLKIAEIAELVGYDSVDHFSRTFKKKYNLTPLDYRREAH